MTLGQKDTYALKKRPSGRAQSARGFVFMEAFTPRKLICVSGLLQGRSWGP